MRPRLHGLDTLRAAAIALVFVYHYDGFVADPPVFGWLGRIGWTGVDLFFVLSGYLIGNQLLKGQRLGTFWARRALRTLPVYWLVLALYFAFPSVREAAPPPPLWRFLTFTQNIGLQPGTSFSHAWSLCIEEQFYLVLPLALLVVRRRAGFFVAALMLAGMAMRAWQWRPHDGYYPHVYYATPCRFDELLPGVALALAKNFRPALWTRITSHGNAWLAAGVTATALSLWLVGRYFYVDERYGFAMTVVGYPLVACSFALLVLAALSPTSWLATAKFPGAYPVALWSYSIYLTHKAIAVALHRGPLIDGVVCVVVGAALYYAVERPFLRLRDRLWAG